MGSAQFSLFIPIGLLIPEYPAKASGQNAFLLKAVEFAKIRCSHCCLVIRKAAIKSYSALLLTEQWG